MSKTNYCLFCGTRIPKGSIIQGGYHLDACIEPSCPYYGHESGSEYESMEGFNIIDPNEDDNDDMF